MKNYDVKGQSISVISILYLNSLGILNLNYLIDEDRLGYRSISVL